MTNYIIHNKNNLKQRLNKFEEGGNTIWNYVLNSTPIGATYNLGNLIGDKIKKELVNLGIDEDEINEYLNTISEDIWLSKLDKILCSSRE